jgi:hypothetical protein
MNTIVRSKSHHGVIRKSTSGGQEKAPQYSDFDNVIGKEFGIINDIEILFSESSEETSQGAQKLDQPNH